MMPAVSAGSMLARSKEAQLTRRAFLSLIAMAVLLPSSGATCNRMRRGGDVLAPAAFAAPPTLAEIIYAVNAHTSRVQSLQTDSASLSTPGFPSLRATIAMERPRRFRLRANFLGLGPELDVGSNDEVVWFWAKSSPEPAIYYARHEQLAAASLQPVVPVEPAWLMDAFGLVQMEPGGQHEGPLTRPDGSVEIRSRLGPAGQYVRTLVIDSKYGWIREQQIADTTGQLIVAAKADAHRYDPVADVSLPHRVEIQVPRAGLSFVVDVSQYSINQLAGDPAQLWSLPQMEGYNLTNLAESRFSAYQVPGNPAQSLPAQAPSDTPYVGFRPRYRGYSASR